MLVRRAKERMSFERSGIMGSADSQNERPVTDERRTSLELPSTIQRKVTLSSQGRVQSLVDARDVRFIGSLERALGGRSNLSDPDSDLELQSRTR